MRFFGGRDKRMYLSTRSNNSLSKEIIWPILDRIDLHIDVPSVKIDKLTDNIDGESSENIRSRVQKAKEIQLKRFEKSSISGNSDMGPKEIKIFCMLSPECLNLLRAAVNRMHLSARAYHRILKVARTIADLAGSADIDTTHIAEGLQYRSRMYN